MKDICTCVDYAGEPGCPIHSTAPRPSCHKCGQPAPDDAANRSAWLIAQRKGAPDGYMVVRCPDHITKHALMLAGLPQQDSRERIMNLIERGLKYEIEPGYFVNAWHSPAIGKYCIERPEPDNPYNTEVYDTFDQLLTAMRKIQPDMRRWSTIK
jgi:hypothetical protein